MRTSSVLVLVIVLVGCDGRVRDAGDASPAPGRDGGGDDPDPGAEVDFGGYRPEYPPFAGYATRGAFGAGEPPALYFVDTLSGAEDPAAIRTDGACASLTCYTGSLATCLLASGPRVCLFEVSGYIDLGDREIYIDDPYLVVAGQTAPSPGITIRNGGLAVYQTHDVVLQHLRVRPGDTGVLMFPTARHDAIISYLDQGNIVWDHVSASWAGGKNMILGGDHDGAGVLIWRSINAEALYRAANVDYGGDCAGCPSSLGTLSGGGRATAHAMVESLLAHNADRNPEIHGGSWQFLNNVIYDWGNDPEHNYPWASFFYGIGEDEDWQANFIGNKYITGPGVPPNAPLYAIGVWAGAAGTALHIDDNAIDAAGTTVEPFFLADGMFDPRQPAPVLPLDDYTVRPGAEIDSLVLAVAGARPRDRDPVDARVVGDVAAGTGGMISSQDDVGGYPELSPQQRSLISALPPDPFAVSPLRGPPFTQLEDWLWQCAKAVESDAAFVCAP